MPFKKGSFGDVYLGRQHLTADVQAGSDLEEELSAVEPQQDLQPQRELSHYQTSELESEAASNAGDSQYLQTRHYSRASKVLGIVGICTGWLVPLAGETLGIIGLCLKKEPGKRERDITLNVISLIEGVVFEGIRFFLPLYLASLKY